MKKRTKPISNFQRRNDSVCGCVDTFSCSHKQRQRLVNKQELDENTGRVLTKCEFQSYDPAAEINKFNVNDFCLENLTAIGAQLNPSKLEASRFDSIDSIPEPINE